MAIFTIRKRIKSLDKILHCLKNIMGKNMLKYLLMQSKRIKLDLQNNQLFLLILSIDKHMKIIKK